MKRLMLMALGTMLVTIVAVTAEDASWGQVKAEQMPGSAGKPVMSANAVGGPVDYVVRGWGQSDSKDLFHLLFDGAPGYTGQYAGSNWVFTSPFVAVGGNCKTVSYAPEPTADPVAMVLCSSEQGAYVNGHLRLSRRLITETSAGFDPADPFGFVAVEGPPYISWRGEYGATIVEIAIKGNMAAILARVDHADPPDPTSPEFLWLVEDRGAVPDQPQFGTLANMLSWAGDRRTYVAPVAAWENDAGISTCQQLLYAGTTGQMDDYPASNKDLKAWPIGGVEIRQR